MAQQGAAVPPVGRSASGARAYELPLVREAVGRAVNRMAWPIIMENLFQSALGTANMLMVARLGATAVAGIGTAMQVVWVLQASMGAVTTGTTVLVGRFTGSREPDRANTVIKQSLVLGLIISAIFAVLGLLFSEWAITAMGAEPEVVRLGTDYMLITSATAGTMVMMFIVGAALRGAGDSRTPMLVTGGINFINVVASYMFIFGVDGIPAMGVAGAAWAAALSRAIGALVLLWLLVCGRCVLDIRGRSGWRPDFPLIKRIMRLGLPSMAEQFLLSGGNLAYGVIAISLGTLLYAAQRITFQVISMAFMPGMGFAMAATAMVSQYFGAKREDLAEAAGRYAVRTAFLLMSAIGLCIALSGTLIMRAFTDDAAMVAVGAQALIVVAFSQPFQAIGQVTAGGLRGAGDTRFPMWATFLGIWFIRVPFAYLFGPLLGLGLSGLYVSNVMDGAARAVVNYFRYRGGAWRKMRV